MTELRFLAGVYRDDDTDLIDLSVRLAQTPCGSLYQRHKSPDRELAAFVTSTT